jgi:hypothetical protein
MSFSRIRGQDALAVLIWSLAFVTTADGEDLFSFQFQGKVLAFVVASRDPITATVDQNTVANIGLKWGIRFYGLQDVNIDGIEFRADPTRFWLVRFSTNEATAHETLYAIVLPDGSIVEPTVRERI